MDITNVDHSTPTRSGSYVGYALLMLAILGVTTACGTLDYNVNRSNLKSVRTSTNGRELGTIYFHYADGSEPYAVTINRVRHGYAAQAPLYNDGDIKMDFIASRERDVGSFIGVRSRLEF